MFRSTTFRARIFWSLVPIYCAIFIAFGLFDLYQQNQLAKSELGARAKSIAENIAYSSRLAVLTEDRWLLEAVVQNVTGAADFAYVWIYGDRWKSLVHGTAKLVDLRNLKPELDDSDKARLGREGGVLFDSFSVGKESYVEYIAPVTSVQLTVPYELRIEPGQGRGEAGAQRREQTIGAIRLGLSTSRIDAHLASFLKWRAGSLLGVLFLSSLGIFYVSARITRPVHQLTEQAKQMSQGLWSASIPVESRDEIGQLAISFNDMARSLNELYAGLERKVAERTNELGALNMKLTEASQHKSRFLANVNHELRTPVSSIIGYARVLRREGQDQFSPRQRENLEEVLRNAERLLRLIDSLMDFAKIEAGKTDLSCELVRIDELMRSAVNIVEPMLNKDCVELVCELPENLAPLHTDPEKVRQIIINLLGNAVKFTDQGEIRISACQANGAVKLAVTDTGIGIAEADMNRIFEEFDRGRLSNDGSYNGTGLGLAIVKSLVDMLGGSITVASEVGKGSTFTVTLPVNAEKTTTV